MRILHLINGEYYAGAERVQDLLAQRLPDFGYEVEWACVKAGRFPEARQAQDVPLFPLHMTSKLDLRPAFTLASLIRDRGHVLLHAHTPRTILLARVASRLARVPFVYHIHSPVWADSTDAWRNWSNAKIESLCSRGAAHLIAVTRELRDELIARGRPESRVSVVLNGVPSEGPLKTWRRPEQAWSLGMVALFRPRKGLEVALQALAMLISEGHPVRLRAVGPFVSHDYEMAIKKEASALGLADRIDWIGFSNDVRGELHRMHVFVLPSLFGEGLPMVIPEAMAAGIPIVATRAGGVPEAIRDGEHALLVRPGDPASLAEAVRAMITGKVAVEEMRQAAHGRQSTALSDVSMAEGTARVYDAVLGP